VSRVRWVVVVVWYLVSVWGCTHRGATRDTGALGYHLCAEGAEGDVAGLEKLRVSLGTTIRRGTYNIFTAIFPLMSRRPT
jgi:hypothetical protein